MKEIGNAMGHHGVTDRSINTLKGDAPPIRVFFLEQR